MKKLLGILAAVGLTATASSAVVACGSSKKAPEENVKMDLSNPDGVAIDTAVNKGNGYYQTMRELALKISKVSNDKTKTADGLKDSKNWNDEQIKDGNDALLSIFTDGKDISLNESDILSNMQADSKDRTLTVKMVTVGDLIEALNNSKTDVAKGLQNLKSTDFIGITESHIKEGYPYQIKNIGAHNAQELSKDTFKKDEWQKLFDKGNKEVKIVFSNN